MINTLQTQEFADANLRHFQLDVTMVSYDRTHNEIKAVGLNV